MDVKIAPSLLSANFARLGADALLMQRAGADMLHLDVMDGHFVPNITIGPPVIRDLRGVTDLLFDVHLMISDPLRYIGDFADAGADMISFHVEAGERVSETIDAIVAAGKIPALALRPGTPCEAVFPWLDRLGMVLVMTVEPGFGGQAFRHDVLPKITALRGEATRRRLSLDIQVDGGIDATTAPLAVQAGANVLVAGSAIFCGGDPAGMLARLRRAGSAPTPPIPEEED